MHSSYSHVILWCLPWKNLANKGCTEINVFKNPAKYSSLHKYSVSIKINGAQRMEPAYSNKESSFKPRTFA